MKTIKINFVDFWDIDKENNVVYRYAERQLDKSVLDLINKECIDFEEKNKDVKEKYI